MLYFLFLYFVFFLSYGMHTKRKEILFNIDPCSDLHGERLPGTDFDTRVKSSIRLGVWKVLTGRQGKSFSSFHSLGRQICKIKIWCILSYQLFEVVIIGMLFTCKNHGRETIYFLQALPPLPPPVLPVGPDYSKWKSVFF